MEQKWKAIASVMLIIMIICAVFTIHFISYCKDNLDGCVKHQTDAIRIIVETIAEENGSYYRKRIKSFVTYQASQGKVKMTEAFARQDRKELLRLSSPYYNIFKKENSSFSSFAWILSDNHAFLRVHNPSKFGEDISRMRPDIVSVNREQRPSSGFTTGYLGLQYRVVQPVFFAGKHIGAIQFGLEDRLLLDTISKKVDIPVGMVLPREKFNIIKRSTLPSMAVDSHGILSLDLALFEEENGSIDWSLDQQRVLLHGREHVVVKVLDLLNYARQSQGHLFVALDISREVADVSAGLVFILSLSTILLVLSFLVLSVSFGAMVRKIVDLRSVEQTNLELEERVRERTAELRREELRRFESLKTMAGAIAHRFNNAMMAVQGYLELLQMSLPEGSPEKGMACHAMTSAKGASQVGSMMLTYVGQRHLQLISMNLADLVRESVSGLKDQFSSSIALRFVPPAQPFYCLVDAQQMKEVVTSIITNAIESLPDSKGAIAVTFGQDECDVAFFPTAFQNAGQQNGTYVYCQVSDSGHGITKEDLERIFEPFFTTRFVGRGLGLALAAGIVRKHHGALAVESTSGLGTVVRLLLPAATQSIQEYSVDSDQQSVQASLSGEIIFADDEEAVLEVGKKTLEHLGFTVHTAMNGKEAVAVVKASGSELRAVILDVSMPEMDGIEAMIEIRKMGLAIPVLLCSGFAIDDLHFGDEEERKPDGFLQKPFELSVMKKTFENMLS